MSPWLFVAIGAFVSVLDFLVGLYLSRRDADSSALYVEGGGKLSAEASRRAGKLIMILSPVPVIGLSLVGFMLFGEGGQ